jgi:AmmeMemoRadiSam system protein A
VGLTRAEKRFLLEIARRSFQIAIEAGGHEDVTIDEESLSDSLKERKGIFVAIYREGRLRGCIGIALGVLPLWQACKESARSAALKDVRLATLRRDELFEITFEITVIGQQRAFDDLSELCPGTIGLVLRKGFQQEAFLPRAISHLIKDGHRVFDHLRATADIDPHDDSPEVWEAFEAEVFSEIDMQGE